ncbi:MAG: hypothetical protein Q4A16_03080 [Lautropia sp.]|nr:hypothetical protein [Lautropia sp.]
MERVLLSDSMVAGGLLSVSHFDGQGGVMDVLDEMERQWANPDLPPMRSDRDGWKLITRVDGDAFETVELRQITEGLYQGRRIRWKNDRRAQQALQKDEEWFRTLLPARVTIQPAISHRDGGHRSSTFVAFTDDRLLKLDSWVDRKLQRQGFRRHALPDEGKQAFAMSGVSGAFYARAHEEIALTLTRQGERQVLVMHWRR